VVSAEQLPPTLRRLPLRQGKPPRVDVRYPCLQLEDTAPPHLRERLLEWARGLEGVTVQPTELNVPGLALVLKEKLAKGQPEAFIRGREFAIVRKEGSVHLTLRPEWGQKVLDKGWATIHPLVRYMAGALPPQNMIVYAPRDEKELRVVWKILQAAYAFARGEVEGRPLPDSAW
jgi:hypothetical protein